MNTKEAAYILKCTRGHVAYMLNSGKLTGRKGLRGWNSYPESVEKYRLIVEGPQSEPTDQTADLPTAERTPDSGDNHSQEPRENIITETDSLVANIVSELEEDAVAVAGKRITMAQLFYMLSQYFLNGIEPGSIFPSLLECLPQGDEHKRANEVNEAFRKLMFELRTLQLVHDENRIQGTRGYTITVSTTLGAKVIRALQKRKLPLSDQTLNS